MDCAILDRPARLESLTAAELRAMAARTMDAERARKLAILADQLEQGAFELGGGGKRRLPVLPPA